MFGIGASELVIIGVVLLIAVGPTRLPKLLKAVVSSYREFRRATRELRANSGIDELLQDEDLRDLRKPLDLGLKDLGKPLGTVSSGKAKGRKRALGSTERSQENPPEGVDLHEIHYDETRPSEEEREAIRAAKQVQFEKDEAIKRAKEAAAKARIWGGPTSSDEPSESEVSAADQAVIDAKNAAAETETSDPEEAASAED